MHMPSASVELQPLAVFDVLKTEALNGQNIAYLEKERELSTS
jgi:hypothetical protein